MVKTPDLSHVRNVGIVAHVDAGKTTLTERLLYYTGALHKIGEVDDGAAHMDFLAEERAHGITITAAVTKAPWRDHVIQLVDTPGHVDFSIEVERSMRVLDGCVVVLDGVRGVEPQTETVWRQRDRFSLPALFFVNKMDRPGADFRLALDSVATRLRAEPVPVTVPLPEQEGVVHLIERSLLRFKGERGEEVEATPCDEALWGRLAPYRETLLLAAAEEDETLADRVLGGGEPSPEAVWAALRSATRSGRVQPCFAGSALHNQGVQPLLDGIVRLLPNPLERPPGFATLLDGGEERVAVDAAGPLVALAFKVQLWDGRRHVFARVYRGTLRPGEPVAIPRGDNTIVEEHAARVFDVDAHRRTRLDVAYAGQVVLLAGLRHARTGDTLCSPTHPLVLEGIEAREPVLSLALEPASSDEEERLVEVLGKLAEEDPSLEVTEEAETGQRLLRGMGELHLQVVLERLEREFHLKVRAGEPDVALRESIRGEGSAEVCFEQSAGGERRHEELKARVRVRVSSQPRKSGVAVEIAPHLLPEGAALSELQGQALEEGARDYLKSGPRENVPLADMRIAVEEVELFGRSSRPEALRAAASMAVRSALLDANGLVLRPIMRTEVVVPEENLGVVLGDLQARRAMVLETTTRDETATVVCDAPLDRFLGYSTVLRSFTHGRGSFSMVFERFDTA